MRLAATSLCLVLAGAATARAQSFLTFESAHVRPLALSPSGRWLLAVNTTDNRLQVLETKDGSLAPRGEVVVGMEPVAVAARTESQAFVVNHLSDSVSVVDYANPDRPFVVTTLPVGDEPRDVVIAGAQRNRVFVTAARRGQNRPPRAGDALSDPGLAELWVFDASDLAAPPRLVPLPCDVPRALAVSPDGRRVHAAAFLSGNRTTTLHATAADPSSLPLIGDGFAAPPLPPPLVNDAGLPAPRAGLIVQLDGDRWRDEAGKDWTPRVRFRLPDQDVFTLDAEAEPPRVVQATSGAGTVLFNLAVHPLDGRIYVSNLELRNAVRFEPELRGRFVENRVTIIDGDRVRPVHLNAHIDYDNPEGSLEEIEASLALPAEMAFTADGSRLYVCALASGRVAVLDADGRLLRRIAVGDNPTGMVLHEKARRLYVMERLFHAVAIVDLDSEETLNLVPLRYTPEPVRIREGRQYLYDARQASAHGDASCASCHIFADVDGLAWDLGDPEADEAGNPLEPAPPLAGRELPAFHPMKGPMATQSLRGLAGAGPMHWRGDRNGGAGDLEDAAAAFMAFHPAFRTLLGAPTDFPLDRMEKLRDFVLALRYPPNPVAPLDGSLTPAQAAGRELFHAPGTSAVPDGAPASCVDCHASPLGTEGAAAVRAGQAFKVPHLRSLYQKLGMSGYALPRIERLEPFALTATPTPFAGDGLRGFGFTHDGSVPTIADFLLEPGKTFLLGDEPERPGAQKARELEAYLLAFPTGLAPAVGQQVTLAAAGLAAALPRWRLLDERAAAGDGELVLHGQHGGLARGWLRVGGGGEAAYLSDRAAERFTAAELLRAVSEEGAVLTAMLVPPGSGRRIGIDRDEDGALDRDEIDQGFDPADPASRPAPAARRALRGDCNGDRRVDISDAVFALSFLFQGGEAPPCAEPCETNGDGRLDLSDGVFALRFLFQGGPAPGAYPDCEPVGESCLDACGMEGQG